MHGKNDELKPRWDLIDLKYIEDVVKVLTFGAKKYKDYGWREVKPFKERYLSALMRHVAAWSSGEIFDKETGQSHLDHVICNALFLKWWEQEQEIEKNGGYE